MTDFNSDEDWEAPKPAKHLNASFTVLIGESISENKNFKNLGKSLLLQLLNFHIRAYLK